MGWAGKVQSKKPKGVKGWTGSVSWMRATCRVDQREFNQEFRRYMQTTKRGNRKAMNTKGYFISRRAVLETEKASMEKMAHELGQLLAMRKSRRGKRYFSSRGMGLINNAKGGTAPMLALIINARRGRKGKPGLYGDDMRIEAGTVFSARARSIAYIKSGWLPAIADLKPLADTKGAPRAEPKVKRIGRAKGYAQPAREALKPVCRIVNEAWAKHDRKSSLDKYGSPGLQKAFDFETRSMREYILKRMERDARRQGIRTK